MFVNDRHHNFHLNFNANINSDDRFYNIVKFYFKYFYFHDNNRQVFLKNDNVPIPENRYPSHHRENKVYHKLLNEYFRLVKILDNIKTFSNNDNHKR